MPPKISVVVPFHNVEAYLAECLESLAAQTLPDLQVIMVDDGSTDGGAVLAKEFAGRDGRFALLQRANAGPGPARNAGVARATGEYLAFADGDDVLPPYAYELMVGTLERTGSDLVGGNVARLEGGRAWESWLHAEAYARTVLSTHIRRHPVLLQDRTVWNKVFRRSFWDAHGFSFPAILYEDPPVGVGTHVLASAVDLLDKTVYYWRRRPGSITQRRHEFGNITDRMTSIGLVRAILAEHAPQLLPTYYMYALDLDVRALIFALPGATVEERRRLVEMGAAVVADAGPSALAGLESIKRLELHLLARRMVPELVSVLRFEERGSDDVPVERRGRFRRRWYARYPFFGDVERAVPDETYDVTDEFRLMAAVDRVEWDADVLLVEGHAHFNRLDVSRPEDSRIRIRLRDPRTAKEIRLPVRRIRCPAATERSGQSLVSHDWSGFAVRIDPADLRVNGRWRPARWEMLAEVTTAGLKAVQRLAPAAPGLPWTAPREVAPRVMIRPTVADGAFVVQIKQAADVVTGHRKMGDQLALTGWARHSPRALVARRQGAAEIIGETISSAPAEHGWTFTATLSLNDLLAGDRGLADPDTGSWEIRLISEAGPRDLTVACGIGEARYTAGDREFVLTRTPSGDLCGIERTPRPVVTAAAWSPDGRLTLTGDFTDPTVPPEHLTLRRHRSGEEHRIPLTWEGQTFTAECTPGQMVAFATQAPLGGGTWRVLATTRSGEVPVAVERDAIPGLPGWHPVGTHEIQTGVHQTDALLLHSRTALAVDERGRHAQRLLQDRDYPVYLRSPLADVAVFDSYAGSQYSCSPRAIYEELVRRVPGLDCVWISKDGQFTVPGAPAVFAGTRDHYRVLARARYVITNFGLPPWFAKREGQTYLQTWHGTPLKRLAYDLRDMPYRRTEKPDWLGREVPRWDLLLSPNPFTTPIMRRAFRYDGEILETGYPRNDILTSPDAPEIAARTRVRLGIPRDRKVILYAPTWRDDHHFAPGRRTFSLELDVPAMARALGDDHVLLIRAHYLITDRDLPPAGGFVIDVSRYPDIAELYLAADVLITDYSSAMFDFAVTGKPMLFFTYDLERYRDHVRGFYFDFETAAPGPLLRTAAEVTAAVPAIDDLQRRYAGAYAAFTAAYCPHDDGRASARVIDHLLTHWS